MGKSSNANWILPLAHSLVLDDVGLSTSGWSRITTLSWLWCGQQYWDAACLLSFFLQILSAEMFITPMAFWDKSSLQRRSHLFLALVSFSPVHPVLFLFFLFFAVSGATRNHSVLFITSLFPQLPPESRLEAWNSSPWLPRRTRLLRAVVCGWSRRFPSSTGSVSS